LEKRCKIEIIENQFIYRLFEDGMREVTGEKEARKNELIQAIEEKADHDEYKAGRRSLHTIAPRREYIQS
jgi:translation initiation factor IF-2